MFLLDATKAPDLLQALLDPTTIEFSAAGAALMAAIALPLTLVGAAGLWWILRGYGEPDGELTSESRTLGVPLAFAALIAPGALLLLLRPGVELSSHPLELGLLDAAIACACILALRYHPWERKDAPEPVWARFRWRQLPRLLAVWVLAYPVLQAAILGSVALSQLVGFDARPQDLLSKLQASEGTYAIVGWYVLASVGAPLWEEFFFRLVLFGALIGPLTKASRGMFRSPWLRERGGMMLAAAISVVSFVLVHGVYSSGQAHVALPLAVLALILTGLYAYTRSIWPPVLFHAAHNALVVTLQLSVVGS